MFCIYSYFSSIIFFFLSFPFQACCGSCWSRVRLCQSWWMVPALSTQPVAAKAARTPVWTKSNSPLTVALCLSYWKRSLSKHPAPLPALQKPHILVVTIIITRDSNPGLMCLWMRILRGFYTGQIFALHVWEINAKITSRSIFSVVAHNGVNLMTSVVFSSSPQLTFFYSRKVKL